MTGPIKGAASAGVAAAAAKTITSAGSDAPAPAAAPSKPIATEPESAPVADAASGSEAITRPRLPGNKPQDVFDLSTVDVLRGRPGGSGSPAPGILVASERIEDLIHGRQGNGTPVDPDGTDELPGPIQPSGLATALSRLGAGRAAREAGAAAGSAKRDADTASATAVVQRAADEAGIEYDPSDLDDPRYAQELTKIDEQLDGMDPSMVDILVGLVGDQLGPDATLKELVHALWLALNETAGRQNNG